MLRKLILRFLKDSYGIIYLIIIIRLVTKKWNLLPNIQRFSGNKSCERCFMTIGSAFNSYYFTMLLFIKINLTI